MGIKPIGDFSKIIQEAADKALEERIESVISNMYSASKKLFPEKEVSFSYDKKNKKIKMEGLTEDELSQINSLL